MIAGIKGEAFMEERIAALEKKVADLEEKIQDRQINDVNAMKKQITERLNNQKLSYL